MFLKLMKILGVWGGESFRLAKHVHEVASPLPVKEQEGNVQ